MNFMDLTSTLGPDGCPEDDVSSAELWQYVQSDRGLYVMYIICTILTIVMIVSFIEATVFVFRKIPHADRATSIVWILGIYPIYGCTSLFGMYFPKAALFCNLTASLYFSVCLYQFWVLLMCYFGDEGKAIANTTSKKITLFSCCDKATIKMDEKKFFWMKFSIWQVATFQPMVLLIEDILWLNGTYNTTKISLRDAFIYLNVLSFASNVLAMVALVILYKLARDHLQPYFIRPKFILVTSALIVANLQVLFLHILTVTGLFPCREPFKSQTRANRLQSLLLVFESLVMFPVAWIYFRTRRGNIVSVHLGRETPNHNYERNPLLERLKQMDRTSSNGSHYNSYTAI